MFFAIAGICVIYTFLSWLAPAMRDALTSRFRSDPVLDASALIANQAKLVDQLSIFTDSALDMLLLSYQIDELAVEARMSNLTDKEQLSISLIGVGKDIEQASESYLSLRSEMYGAIDG